MQIRFTSFRMGWQLWPIMPSCFNLAFKQKSRQQNLGNSTVDHIPRASPRVFHICWMAEALGEPLVDLGSNHFKMAGGPTIPWIVRQVWCFGIIWFSDPRQLWDMGQRLLYIDSLRVQTCNTRMEPRMKNICITLYVFYYIYLYLLVSLCMPINS